MNRIFTPQKGIQVPDGTMVYPFINGLDRTYGLPWNSQEGFSIASGEIAPNRASKIHLMPLVTQVAFVLRGLLEVHMKDPESPAPYTLRVAPYEAILTRPGTFLQLINTTHLPVQVLYIVSPPYVFEMDESGKAVYDDAVVFDEGWEELKKLNWAPPGLQSRRPTPEARQEAIQRLTEPKGKTVA